MEGLNVVNEIKVSVIIPVYNTEKYLIECLDSVLNQTLREIEVICVDDGSTDNSLQILKEYQKKDARIIVLTQENKSAGAARNYGLSIAKGKYLSFLDSDDFFDKDLLKKAYKNAEKNNADIVVYKFKRFNEKTKEYTNCDWGFRKKYWPNKETVNYKDNPNDIFNSFHLAPWNKLYNKHFIEKNQILFQDNKRTNDLLFVCEAFAIADRISLLDEVLLTQRMGGFSSQATNYVAPLDFYKALLALKNFLREKNLFEIQEESYKKLVVSTCNHNINKNKGKEKEKIYELLLREGIKNLEVKNFLQDDTDGLLNKVKFQLKFEQAHEDRKVKIISGTGFAAKVSVIIPVYNVEKYLEECLDSICDQTLEDIEIICVNDGSPDNSINILRKYADVDKRIVVLSQENGGLSVARNTGINFAHGKYIYFCDSDDKLELSALEELYNRAVTDNLDMLYFDAEAFFESKEVENKFGSYKTYYKRGQDYKDVYDGKELLNQLLKNHDYLPAAWLNFINREFLLKNELFFEPGILHEDNLWSYKCALTASRVAYLPKVFFHRRVRANSIVTQKISFEHAYGYFISAIRAIDFLKNINLTDEQFRNINNLIKTWLKNGKDKFDKIEMLEKLKVEALSPYEKLLFNLFIIDQDLSNKKKNEYPKVITKTVVVNNGLKTSASKIIPYYKKYGLKNTILKIKEKIFS